MAPHRCCIFISEHIGHINAILGFAEALRAGGMKVTIVGGPLAAREAEQRQFKTAPNPHPPDLITPFGIRHRPDPDLLRAVGLRRFLRSIRDDRRAVADWLDRIDAFFFACSEIATANSPSIAMFDPFVSLYQYPFAARGVLCRTLSTKPSIQLNATEAPYTSRLQGEAVRRSAVLAHALWTLHRSRYVAWEAFERIVTGVTLRDLHERFAIRSGTTFRWRNRGVLFDASTSAALEIVLHAAEIEFAPSIAARSAHYVGPCVRAFDLDQSFDWDGIPAQGIVYCVLSTVIHPGSILKRRRFFAAFMRAMAKRKHLTGIVVAGPLSKELHVLAPQNCRVFEDVPQLQVLQRAALVVCHGGSNTVKEALYFGVPVIAVPDRAEQPGLAARLVHHGVGFSCHFERATSEEIGCLVDKAINCRSTRERVNIMQVAFGRYSADNVAYRTVAQIVSDASLSLAAGDY